MKEQTPSVRDYSTKGKLTPLIEQDLTQNGNSTLNIQSLSQEPERDGESSTKGIFKSDASVSQEVLSDNVDSNKVVEPVVQTTQSDSHSEIESKPQEAVAPWKSRIFTKGAPPTRYGHAVTHKLVCPTISCYEK